MRAALSQVMGDKVELSSMFCASSDCKVSGGGRTNCPLEVSDTLGHLDLKSQVQNSSAHKLLGGKITPAEGGEVFDESNLALPE